MATSDHRTAVDQKQDCSEYQPTGDPKLETVKSNDKRGFLHIPLEIRMAVYDIFFGTRFFPMSRPGFKPSDVEYATARHKLPLLVTNRDIWVEASPFFYRLHVFGIRMLNTWQFCLQPHYRLSVGKQQVLQDIRHIELTYRKREYDSAEEYNVSTYLRLLRLGCPALESLRIELVRFNCLTDAEKESVAELQQLWPRLDSLQVCVEYKDELDAMPQGDIIAPGQEWHREVCKYPLVNAMHHRRRRELRRTVFSVARPRKADERG